MLRLGNRWTMSNPQSSAFVQLIPGPVGNSKALPREVMAADLPSARASTSLGAKDSLPGQLPTRWRSYRSSAYACPYGLSGRVNTSGHE